MPRLQSSFKSTTTGVEILSLDDKDQSIEKLKKLADSGLSEERIISYGEGMGMCVTNGVIVPSLIPPNIGSNINVLGFVITDEQIQKVEKGLLKGMGEQMKAPNFAKRFEQLLNEDLFKWQGFSSDEKLNDFFALKLINPKNQLKITTGKDQDGAFWISWITKVDSGLHSFFKDDLDSLENIMKMYRSKVSDSELAFAPVETAVGRGLITMCQDIVRAYGIIDDVQSELILEIVSEIIGESIDEYRYERNNVIGLDYVQETKMVRYYDGLSKVSNNTLISSDDEKIWVSDIKDLDFAPLDFNPEGNDRFSNIEKISLREEVL